VVRRHPELFEILGVGDVANLELREQFYTALLRYAFVLGVEDGLNEQVRGGAITGAELRSLLERWTASWAIHQASASRAWRTRAAALAGEVARRDDQLASVVQEKDAQIATLEAHLARINALPPVRLLHAAKRLITALRHNHWLSGQSPLARRRGDTLPQPRPRTSGR
jgi:hypothetical protein